MTSLRRALWALAAAGFVMGLVAVLALLAASPQAAASPPDQAQRQVTVASYNLFLGGNIGSLVDPSVDTDPVYLPGDPAGGFVFSSDRDGLKRDLDRTGTAQRMDEHAKQALDLVSRESGDEEDLEIGTILPQHPCELPAPHPRHGEVGDQHVERAEFGLDALDQGGGAPQDVGGQLGRLAGEAAGQVDGGDVLVHRVRHHVLVELVDALEQSGDADYRRAFPQPDAAVPQPGPASPKSAAAVPPLAV